MIRDIALSGMTQKEIGEKYGVGQSSVSEFATRNREAINAVRADADNEYAGILIAQKRERLALLEEIADEAMKPTPKIDNKGNHVQDRDGEYVYEIDGRAAMQAVKQAAEEMGQLPTRLQISGGLDVKTNYTIDGVDPNELR